MPSIEDLVAKMASSPQNVTFTQLQKVCTHFFGAPRIRGSHHYYSTPYARGARSTARRTSGYSAYSSVRDEGYIGPQRSYDQGSMSQQGRTIYSDYPRTQQSRPVQQQRSYDSYPQRSYDQGSSNTTNNSNSGGGGGYTAPPRRR